MTHCSDDELVLQHYGESPEAGAHVATCAACAERARDLALLLAVIDEPVPGRDERYGFEVWERVQPHLDQGTRLVSLTNEGRPDVVNEDGMAVSDNRSAGLVSAARATPGRFVLQPGLRWGLAAAATLTLVATSFLAGRLSIDTAPVMAPAPTAVKAVDPQLARRVLLLSVADHLERSDRVLTDIMNAPEGDLSVEQQWADDLIAANRLYRQDAMDAKEGSVADVLDELERTLLDVVHRPSESPADLDQIRRRIDSAALVFKVRVLTTELRQRQLAPEGALTSAATPVS